MNAKNLKFLQLFESFVNIDYLSNKALVAKCMKGFFDLDYALAVDVWDYLASTKEQRLETDDRFLAMVSNDMLSEFYNRASTKCVKAINDIPPIRRAIYLYAPTAGEGIAFNILAELLLTNKFTQAEEMLKLYVKNEKIAYGATLKKLLEHIFIELLKKNPSKIDMNKKLSTLMLTYVKKIKTDEKALLEQRIKETQ